MALVLALGLGLLANLILIGTIVQILHGNPEVTLSENATQILIASTSGITGVLGGYMGYRLGKRSQDQGQQDAQGERPDPDGDPDQKYP